MSDKANNSSSKTTKASTIKPTKKITHLTLV